MSVASVTAWLEKTGTDRERQAMTRYGIPNDKAYGIPMGVMKKYARTLGTDHRLAQALWKTGSYEARTIAIFIEDPEALTERQADKWVKDFDNWAICDTACFHLFDRTSYAWAKVPEWAAAPEEFIRRAGYALLWALSVHDKEAGNDRFLAALKMIGDAGPDERPLVNKAINMALRATGKRNSTLNKASIKVAGKLADSDRKETAWIGRHALRELTSDKVQTSLAKAAGK